MMKLYKILLITLMAVSIKTVASGLQQTDSLRYYLDLAVTNNPAVLQKLDEYQAALQKVQQAGSLNDPELNVGVFLSPMELLAGNQVADIQLMQMFPWFGVLRNAKDEMSLMAKAKYESFREIRLQVIYDVQRTWYDLSNVQQIIKVSEKNLKILKTIERLMLTKYKSGTTDGSYSSSSGSGMTKGSNTASNSSGMKSMGGGSAVNSGAISMKTPSSIQSSSMGSAIGLSDLYRIQIEMGDLENAIAVYRNQQRTIVARFNSYLNRPASSSVSITEELMPDSLLVSFKVIADSMLTNNPMLGMLKYEQQSLEARGKMIKRMGYPMVGVGLDYSVINKRDVSTSPMNGKDMIMPMLKITLPIYRRKYKAMQSETSYLKSSTEQGFIDASNHLRTESFEAIQSYEDAGRRIKLYKSQAMLADKSLSIMIKTFSASGAGLTDILQVRQQLLDYEIKSIEAVVEFNTAIAWLNKLMATH